MNGWVPERLVVEQGRTEGSPLRTTLEFSPYGMCMREQRNYGSSESAQESMIGIRINKQQAAALGAALTHWANEEKK